MEDHDILIRIDERTKTTDEKVDKLLLSDEKQWTEIRHLKYTNERVKGFFRGLGIVMGCLTAFSGIIFGVVKAVAFFGQ